MLLTAAAAAVIVVWLSPWSSRYQSEVTQNAKANPGTAALAAGQFRQSNDGNSVLFIEDVKGNQFGNVFLAQMRPKGNARPSVVLADSGHMEQRPDGSQVVTLDKGTRFEGTAMLRDFRITDFTNYQAIIGYKAASLDLSMLPAMLLYLIFFLLQSSLKSHASKGRLDPAVWMWAVNLSYLALAVLLNLWDTVPMRRLRARFTRGGSV